MRRPVLTLCLLLAGCKTAGEASELRADAQNCAAALALPVPEWPLLEGGLTKWIGERPHAAAKSEVDIKLGQDRLSRLEGAWTSLVSGNGAAAEIAARSAGFEVGLLRDGTQAFAVLFEPGGRGVDATLILNLAPRTDLVVEVPHPDFEPGTAEEGADLLLRSGGRALILAGAHRCASSRASACGGKTAVCTTDGVAIPYADTDAGHNAGSAFDTFHRLLAARGEESRFVQLHGMRQGDTWVILSDGGKANRPDDPAWPEEVRDKLRKSLGADVKAVSCQDPEDASRFNHRRLCGTDNTQGRLLNLSPDACAVVAPTATGRFLHVEQTFDVLGGERPGGAVVDAILATLPGC